MSERPGAGVHLDDDRCADLVLGLLPVAERVTAFAHVAACPECEARLLAHASASHRGRAEWLTRALGSPDRAVSRPSIAPLPGTGDGAPPRPGPSPRTARWGWRDRRTLTLAAAAAFVVLIGWPLMRTTPPGPAGPWLPAAGEPLHSRAGAAEDPRIARGLAAYDARDLATADQELSSARATGSTEELRRLYLGHVKLERGDASGSAVLLRTLEWRMIPEPWRRDGVRVLIQALRANGLAASADSLERALRAMDPAGPFVP